LIGAMQLTSERGKTPLQIEKKSGRGKKKKKDRQAKHMVQRKTTDFRQFHWTKSKDQGGYALPHWELPQDQN
jgi:hypothetical protein